MREGVLHAGAAVAVLALCALAAFGAPSRGESADWDDPPEAPAPVPLSAGATVPDAQGAAVPVAAYRRIVVCAEAAIVHELVAVERIAAIDAALAADPAVAWAFCDVPRVAGPADRAAIRALAPDLVILSSRGAPAVLAAAAALRADGVAVYDAPTGTAIERTTALGGLLGATERASELTEGMRLRARIAARAEPRP